MTADIDLLTDAFDRVAQVVHGAVRGLSPQQLAHRVAPGTNTVGWLVWHLTRIQDDHVSDVAATEQVWTAGGWSARCALPFDDGETGYGHSADEVALVRGVSAEDLLGYFDAVHAATGAYLATIGTADLGRIVDDSWDPPVTLAVRLVSVISDDLQHGGQAALLRGILLRS